MLNFAFAKEHEVVFCELGRSCPPLCFRVGRCSAADDGYKDLPSERLETCLHYTSKDLILASKASFRKEMFRAKGVNSHGGLLCFADRA